MVAARDLSNAGSVNAKSRWRFAIVASAVAVAISGSLHDARAAQGRAVMTVSATVVNNASVRAVHNVQSLLITSQDIERGYVDVPVGSRIQVAHSGPCVLELSATGDFFRSVTVSGAGPAAELGRTGGRLVRRACGGNAMASVDLSYRFELEAGVAPGVYRWPLSLTVLQ